MNPTRPSFSQAAAIVAQRELIARVLSKSFIVSTLITLVILVVLFFGVPRVMDYLSESDSSSGSAIAVMPEVVSHTKALEQSNIKVVSTLDEAKSLVKKKEVRAAVVAGNHGLKIIALQDKPSDLVKALTVKPSVELLDPSTNRDLSIIYFATIAFGSLWMMTAMTYGMNIANSVVEEKQTRIVEILLATISSRALIAGKIIGNSLAAFVQILLYACTALFGVWVNGAPIQHLPITAPLIWFLVLFTVGFVMIASLFAAAASLVCRSEDLQISLQPLVWLVMLPYLLLLSFTSNDTVMKVLSFVPLTSPIALPTRMMTSNVSLWEPFFALVILVATTVAVVLIAGRIYTRGLLHMGKSLKWKEAFRRAV